MLCANPPLVGQLPYNTGPPERRSPIVMQFALFYEIPVARPWNERSELEAYQNTL